MTDLATAPPATISIPRVAQCARQNLPRFVHAPEHLMVIGERRLAAASGQTLPNTDPATEQSLARVPRGEATDVDAAVQAAKRAFADPSWADMKPDQRGRILNQVADVIERNADELASIDSVTLPAGATRAAQVDWHPSSAFLGVTLPSLNQEAFFRVSRDRTTLTP